MEVVLSDVYGFCGGVKRAVDKAFQTAEAYENVKLMGELVHNAEVNKELHDLGVEVIDEGSLPEDATVITRSHGTTKSLKAALEERGNRVVDTTCPFVSRIYDIVEKSDEEGIPVVLVGDPDHPEIKGIVSYGRNVHVVRDEGEVDDLPFENEERIALISQTTNPKKIVDKVEYRLKGVFTGDVLRYNTICKATNDRQDACRMLAKNVDCMLVIGGKNSANTKKLAKIAAEYCEHVYHIQTINQLDLRPFKKFNKIGITAGASTPDSVIKEAVSRMDNLNRDEMNNEMMEAIENSFTRVRRGEIVDGEVLYVTDDEVMVNIGYRADGIISRDELSNDPDVKPEKLFEQGDKIQVYVMKMDDGDGNVVLSYKRVENMKVWDKMEEKFENEELVTAHVTNVVKGGLTCDVDGLNGFIPASHASVRFQRDLSKYVGQDLECEIIDFDKSRRKFVLSRKNVEAREIEEKRKEVYATLEEGQVIKGTVQRLTNFGAFVDVGGVDGLIHISELSWNRVKHPSDVVSPGQEVEVVVLKIDEERNRIALGLKQLTKKPWDTFVETVKVGDDVKGTVVNILDFGAFVRLESGVDGLLHVSQISRQHVDKPSDVLEIGQEIEVRVTDINFEDKKISLSMKALQPGGDDEQANREKKRDKKPRHKEAPQVESKPEEENFSMAIGDLIDFDKLETEDADAGEDEE
ncbi:MAG: bifunctional 4-hydroxy-3-methylbut-2-enyl diphosphate reductase/30S ribosomal protein S1 [Peptoniphilus sp.]|nr:bifunctional 4-hydroxy-3-methylbut-2-enyl diphosphate reductase/30S ribosomal protein S1 [Peptoniphilus sp.]MDD7362928.1 bifunctional 4-hydroxy-3-methylbut-2-enyl diphosphate reductase/30S ribosomal protein S1 [Bacillota bacterium]MDY6044168.1 bifunctional 4-hydroxy-3-methylbut-2-enyl diphosphate reductase/30S ribosomal protein S1 [Peptoniphilus sp.]